MRFLAPTFGFENHCSIEFLLKPDFDINKLPLERSQTCVLLLAT